VPSHPTPPPAARRPGPAVPPLSLPTPAEKAPGGGPQPPAAVYTTHSADAR